MKYKPWWIIWTIGVFIMAFSGVELNWLLAVGLCVYGLGMYLDGRYEGAKRKEGSK